MYLGGPITCVHCMQLHVDQFHFDQHVGNCPGTHNQHSSLNDLSLVSTDAAVRDPPGTVHISPITIYPAFLILHK